MFFKIIKNNKILLLLLNNNLLYYITLKSYILKFYDYFKTTNTYNLISKKINNDQLKCWFQKQVDNKLYYKTSDNEIKTLYNSENNIFYKILYIPIE